MQMGHMITKTKEMTANNVAALVVLSLQSGGPVQKGWEAFTCHFLIVCPAYCFDRYSLNMSDCCG